MQNGTFVCAIEVKPSQGRAEDVFIYLERERGKFPPSPLPPNSLPPNWGGMQSCCMCVRAPFAKLLSVSVCSRTSYPLFLTYCPNVEPMFRGLPAAGVFQSQKNLFFLPGIENGFSIYVKNELKKECRTDYCFRFLWQSWGRNRFNIEFY